ncbi:hypothetical protein CLCR_04732 [Cladophialophora carrionii]|uniref:PHD-type domain-containing protein n=1 Tax=Cladophialophora carrionii TaxID=86049 RepID=A0A1C1CKV2_9EURO|nr:hypothetical protein CLCR_04732 [Cladophialophora carrionii]
MAAPPTDPTGSSETNGYWGHIDELRQHTHDTFIMHPAVPPLSFQAMCHGTNDRAELTTSDQTNNLSSQAPFKPSADTGLGPRRASSPDVLPQGHAPPPSIKDSNPNLRGGMPDFPKGAKPGPEDAPTDSDHDFRYSTPSAKVDQAPRSVSTAEHADTATIMVTGQVHTPGATESATIAATKRSGSRRNKQYTLPNGSVVTGKGLGRGRPGIKRGPRKSQVGDQPSPQVMSVDSADASSHGRGPASKERKSPGSDFSLRWASSPEPAALDSEESSEEYNPTLHTRSGRQTQKPTPLTKTIAASASASASPSGKASRNTPNVNGSSTSTPSIKTHPKIKRRIYRGREQFALCEHCLRGHGPPGNVIVFCDACNKCWHQRCHEPQISKQTVADSKAEWYCSECDRILHGKKKEKKPNGKLSAQPVVVALPAVQQAPPYAGPLVGGRFLPPEQKLAYLKTLSKEDLVLRLLHASDLAPDLPLFQTLVPPAPPPVVMPQAQFTSTYVTPVSKVPSFRNRDGGQGDEVDEGYDGYYDEHAALYPKPGHGLQLLPESEDLHMLLEGKESKTFSHWQRSTPGPLFSGSGNIISAAH